MPPRTKKDPVNQCLTCGVQKYGDLEKHILTKRHRTAVEKHGGNCNFCSNDYGTRGIFTNAVTNGVCPDCRPNCSGCDELIDGPGFAVDEEQREYQCEICYSMTIKERTITRKWDNIVSCLSESQKELNENLEVIGKTLLTDNYDLNIKIERLENRIEALSLKVETLEETATAVTKGQYGHSPPSSWRF